MQLGYASPAKLIKDVRLSEIGYWAALYRTDPWGGHRTDVAMATVAAVIANIHRDSRTRPEPFSPQDFMAFLQQPDEIEKSAGLSKRLRAALPGKKADPKKKSKRK